MDALFLLLDAALVGALGLWMVVAVADNWLNPVLNRDAVKMVVTFELMALEYPEHYQQVAHRKITRETTISLLFQSMRAAETVAAAVLICGAGALALAALGAVSAEIATMLALIGTVFFSLVWAGFIIGGNYFAYWYCHQWGQMNHFSLLFWGLLVALYLKI